jgi:hypothetical protein
VKDRTGKSGAKCGRAPHAKEELESAPAGSSAATPSTPSPQLIRSLQTTERVWKRLAEEFGLLTASEVIEILGATLTNRNTLVVLRFTGKIIAVRRGSYIQYPGFQFDRARRTIFPVVEPLIEVARANEWSCEDLTLWMLCPTTSFDEEDRPVDHLQEQELLLAAARSHMEAVW